MPLAYEMKKSTLINRIEVYIRCRALKSKLGSDADPAVIHMIARLESGDYREKIMAAWDLACSGKRAALAIPFLIRYLCYQTGHFIDTTRGTLWLCEESKKALVDIGVDAVPALICSLGFKASESDCDFCVLSRRDFAKSGSDHGVCALTRTPSTGSINDYSRRDLFSNAVWCLGQLNDDRAIDPLCAVLKEEDYDYWYAAKQAAEALGRIGGTKAAEALRMAAENHRDEKVRRQSQKSLGLLRL